MLISIRGYNWNNHYFCYQTGGPITGWAYKRDAL